ncbi:MAG: benzoyl-CoA-dihydrodiol lyase, partial [Candidatus Paceibacteria bacterium]
DVFCSVEEGVRGTRALKWNLVDEVIANSKFAETVQARAQEFAVRNDHRKNAKGIELTAIERQFLDNGSIMYSLVEVDLNREGGLATITINGPSDDAPKSVEQLHREGPNTWMLRAARELDDAILHLRFNELELGVIAFKSAGDPELVIAHEALLLENPNDWFTREILLYWKRVLKRVDMTSRSLVALIEPGSCFAGTLAELLFSVDRSYMADGEFEGDKRPNAAITLSHANFGCHPMGNNLTRLETRFLGAPKAVDAAKEQIGKALAADDADDLGLVTFAFDDIDWEDEVRIFLEERASFSPDALTGMEANLRFAGPETMETRIFGRLTAWQNWIFQRPNAVGDAGALQSYGTGQRGKFDRRRV